nr:TonB-dependent receptor [Sphingomonas sp. Mn802worker]
MQGGQYKYADWGRNGDLDPRLGRQNVFGRVSFDVTDRIQVFGQLSWGRATSNVAFGTQANYGNITIRSDNAFIPASVAARVAALGISSFSLGTLNEDLGKITTNSERTSVRPVIGAKGDFDALGSKWSWDVYGQKTVTHSYLESNLSISANYANAIDSVRNANGAIVCRVTLTNPNSGCVPYNIFGTGVNSQAALDYVRGTAFLRTKLTEDVVAANLRGDPFSTWAGPVSVAAGVEHRREKVSGSVDALDAASLATSIANGTARVPPYFAGNYLPSSGSYHVTEGYLQAVVPLAKDVAFARSLDVNLGVRATDYSTSGYVTTWRAGVTYKPIDDVTIRASRSRDIRAPNLAELFQASQASTSTVNDPARNLATTIVFAQTSGNRDLNPEKADSYGVGLVLQPRFLPGFAASARIVFRAVSINSNWTGRLVFC